MIDKNICPLPPALLVSAIIECSGENPDFKKICASDNRVLDHALGKQKEYFEIDPTTVVEGEKWWQSRCTCLHVSYGYTIY